MSKTLAVIVLISIFALYIDAQAATDYFSTKIGSTCTFSGPRIRKVWKSLDQTRQQAYVKTVVKMKATLMALKQGSSTTSSLYNLFVQTHYEQWNSKAWHGTALFLPVHKWFLWNYESALIYTASQNYNSLGFSKDIACTMTLPYWDWETDFDSNTADSLCPAGGVTYGSKLLEFDDFGSPAATDSSGRVTDGVFGTSKAWTLAYATGGQYRLKRQYNCAGYGLRYSAAMLFNEIIARPTFSLFSSWFEGVPHGWPHMNIGYSMSSMNSPDDPIFMLHHCNIDRIYALWQDCYDYELVAKGSMNDTHWNPLSSTPINPITNKAYTIAIDAQMPYVLSSTGSGNNAAAVYGVVFGSTWPTPRDMWPSINGYKGLNVRYGDDAMVNTYGGGCTKNINGWKLVDVTSKKRDVEQGSADANILLRIQREKNEGKTMEEIIREIAMEDCEMSPPIQITDQLLGWMRMNGITMSQLDSICDKVSLRVNHETGEPIEKLDSDREASSQSLAPVWVIVTASIGCTLVLVAVITLIILYLRKRNEVENIGNSYAEMRE